MTLISLDFTNSVLRDNELVPDFNDNSKDIIQKT